MNLQELKKKNPAELITEAEKLGIENPSTLRKQEILFAILKKSQRKKIPSHYSLAVGTSIKIIASDNLMGVPFSVH